MNEGEMEYTIIIYEAEEGGYWSKVPALPGCGSQGETIDEAIANTREAIESHIVALREDGQEIPAERASMYSRIKVTA
jgi:predicted RNase H-like HicB family nuclease